MKKYKHIISFGSMCSVALFLRENGFREGATIFDWLKSNLESNMKLIENNFLDLLNISYLTQKYTDHPEIIDNTYYDISLSHLFDETLSLKSNMKIVSRIIKNRTQRFFDFINDGPSLLVYYCYEKNDFKWIKDNVDKILNFKTKYKIDILFLSNYAFENDFPFESFTLSFNSIHEPFGLHVTFPFDNCQFLVSYLSKRYDAKKIVTNLKYKEKRVSIKHRLFRKIRRILKIKKLALVKASNKEHQNE